MLRQQVATLPKIIGNELLNSTLDNFKKQGFLGDVFQPWRKRKSKKQGGRAILVKTGRLRRAGRIVRADWDAVVYGNDTPYAKAHNEGSTARVTVKAHQRNKFSKTKVGSGKFTKSGSERMKTVQSISGTGMVKQHTRQMRLPKRQFVGKGQYLMNRLQRVAVAHILKAYK